MKEAEDFDAFVAIVSAGSISEAARELAIPRASLSRRLARLEERLGVRLIHRSTRSLVLTAAGETLFPRASSLLDAAKAAVGAVTRIDDVPRGMLRVSSAPLQSPMLGTLVAEFVQQHPEVSVELRTSTRHIDLVHEQVDIAIRGGVVRAPNLIARPLLHSEMLAFASPEYLRTNGHPETPDDLAQHTCLRGFHEGSRPVAAWPLVGGRTIAVDGPFVTNDLVALLGAAKQGLGIAFLPRETAAPEVDSNQLVPILEGVVGLKVSLSLVWVERKFLDPKVRAFIDMATAWAGSGRLGPPR